MIYNTYIEMLLKSNVIQETIRKNSMSTKVLINGDEYYFLMYHHPFVIEISDLLIENFLDIFVHDLTNNLTIKDNLLITIADDLGIRSKNDWPSKCNTLDSEMFISYNEGKQTILEGVLDRFNLLLPIIVNKGGFKSFKDKTFHPLFDYTESTLNLNINEKVKILNLFSTK